MTLKHGELGQFLRRAREGAGLTRDRLAAIVGLDSSYLYRIETGARRPSREVTLALGEALERDDQTLNEWLVAAGYAPIPLLTSLRAAVRTRGRIRGATETAAQGAVESAGLWASRLESLGLKESTVRRLLDVMSGADLAMQQKAAVAVTKALSLMADTLASPVQTAVIPAAGGQHRLLATHVMQRLLAESIGEAVACGITNVVLVLAPDSVDRLYEPILDTLAVSVVPHVQLHCCEQYRPQGLGDAVLQAEKIVGARQFAVLLPDDVVRERSGHTAHGQLGGMIDALKGLPDSHLLAVASVPKFKMPHCGIARVSTNQLRPRVHELAELAEKPRLADPICAAKNVVGIVGRYVLQPSILRALHGLKQEGLSPLELTAGLKLLHQQGERMLAFELSSKRLDIGEIVAGADALFATQRS